MRGKSKASTSSAAGQDGKDAQQPADNMAIELATGLSISDIEALGSDPSPQTRAAIAVKFAHEFDRIAKDSANRLTTDLLDVFSRDPDAFVRARFAKSIKSSLYLPIQIARRLAKDDIDVAAPILRESPVLDDDVLGEIVTSMPERYALTIAERRPLGEELVNVLLAHRGTRRVAARLLDNEEADLSETVLLDFHDWGRFDPDIAERLRRRPNLPFAFVNQGVVELADSVRWASLGDRMMTKSEAVMLQSRFEGKGGSRCSSKGPRFNRLNKELHEDFERDLLKPSTLLGFLRDRDIDRLECGFSIMAGLDLRLVRSLLHSSDRRGLIALCIKSKFSTADYLAFRMALGLAELGTASERQQQRYSENLMKFAHDQFEKMRADPYQLKDWLPMDKV